MLQIANNGGMDNYMTCKDIITHITNMKLKTELQRIISLLQNTNMEEDKTKKIIRYNKSKQNTYRKKHKKIERKRHKTRQREKIT